MLKISHENAGSILLKIENLGTRLEKGSPALVCSHHVDYFATLHLTAAPLRYYGEGRGKSKRKRKKIKMVIDNRRKRRNT
jgi:hypothetical protein